MIEHDAAIETLKAILQTPVEDQVQAFVEDPSLFQYVEEVLVRLMKAEGHIDGTEAP